MNIVTGYRGTPHITSAQDRAKNQGIFGTGSYILGVGEKLSAEIVSANEIRIRDGVLCMQGCVAVIEEGAYDSCEIENGTQGMQRRDLIVARYTKNAETNVEDVQLVVIEGTPSSSSPQDPSYNEGDIQAGDSPVDFPLYRVNISGVNVSSTTRIAPYVGTQAETDTMIGDTSISGIGDGTVTGAISALNSKISNRTNASVASGYTGGVAYSVVGYMVVVSGWLSAAAASVGTDLVTGLPMPFISSANALIMANNNNAVNSTKRLTLSDHGEIRAGEELSDVNLRFTFAYIKV